MTIGNPKWHMWQALPGIALIVLGTPAFGRTPGALLSCPPGQDSRRQQATDDMRGEIAILAEDLPTASDAQRFDMLARAWQISDAMEALIGTVGLFLAVMTGEAAEDVAKSYTAAHDTLEAHEEMGELVRFIFLGLTVVAGVMLAIPKVRGKQFKDGQMASDFISFYGSKGWYVGKNKMKSWKMAVSSSNWSEPFVASDKVNKVAYCANTGKPKNICKCGRC